MAEKRPNLDSLFEAAVEMKSAAERAAFLDQSCGDDLELRKQLELLLTSDEQAGSFLNQPPAAFEATIIQPGAGEDRSQSLQAGLSAAFTDDQAVVIGNAGHSVLKSLGQTTGMPRVALRESIVEGTDPIVRPKSSEMPQRDSDSRYQLQGEIARGGMGAILKGRDTDLGRDLAIKVLLDQHKNKPEVIQRFVEEAQIGGQLQHPGIAPIYELGQFADKRPFFAMKLVKGETLSKLLADRKDAAEDRGKFIGIFEQICQTMAYAHSRGVIHRDLKPANIMVGAFGEVQVMDWGLAKVLPAGGVADEKKAHDKLQGQRIIHTLRSKVGSDAPGTFGMYGSQTQMGSVMGTPAYMPPEQALGEIDHLDERADVFGLGAILCEILTGKPPYVADDGTRVFRMASRGKLEDCFRRLETCGADEDLVSLTKNCLEMEPLDRPRHAGVLAERVTSYLESVETKLRETELARVAETARAEAETRRVQQQQQSARKLKKLVAGAAVVAMIAGLACIAALMARHESSKLAQIAATEAENARHNAEEARKNETRAESALSQVESQKADVETSLAKAKKAEEIAVAAEEEGRKLLYTTDMRLAPFLWRDDRTTTEQLRTLLAKHIPAERMKDEGARMKTEMGNDSSFILPPSSFAKPDLRGFEWIYYQYLLDHSAMVFSGHRVAVVGGAFSGEDGLVTLDQNGQVRRWNVDYEEEDETARHDLPSGPIAQRRVLSPDGRLAALAKGDKVRVFDAATGQLNFQLDSANNAVRQLIFSRDGDRLVIVDDKIRWLNATNGELVASLDRNYDRIQTVALSADGLTLAVVGHNILGQQFSIYRLNAATKAVAPLAVDITGFGGTLDASAMSPDGKLIALGLKLSGMIGVFDAETGSPIAQDGGALASPASSIAFSEDGARLATADSEGMIKIWADPRKLNSKSTALFTLKGHQGLIQSIEFSSDGKQLVSSGTDKTVRIWDLDNAGTAVRPLEQIASGRATKVQFSPDGQLIACALNNNSLVLWDAATGKAVRQLTTGDKGKVTSVAFSPSDNRLLAVGYGLEDNVSHVLLWDIESGKELGRLTGATDLPEFMVTVTEYNGPVNALAFSPDGQFLVAGFGSPRIINRASYPNPLKVWEVSTKSLIRRLAGHTNTCTSVEFSKDGAWLASSSRDGTAILWSTKTWEATHTLQNPDQDTGFPGVSLRGMVEVVTFAPDGKTLALASREKTLQLWDVASGTLRKSLAGHSSFVLAAAFSPDGQTLASGGSDQTVRLWNSGTGRELMQLDPGKIALGEVQALAFSPEGQSLLAGGSNLALWSTVPTFGNLDRVAGNLHALLKSNADFQSSIRTQSENHRLPTALEKLDANDPRVAAALAATHANRSASRQAWPEAVAAYDRLIAADPASHEGWLRTPGLFRLATALLHQQRPAEAAMLLQAGVKREAQDPAMRQVAGFGIGFSTDTAETVGIQTVLPGSPAARAKLRPGDVIVKVNGVDTTSSSLQQISRMLAGDVGTKVRISVRHPGQTETQEVELVKANNLQDSATAKLLATLQTTLDERLARTPQDAGLLELHAELASQKSDFAQQVADYTAAIEALAGRTGKAADAQLQRLYARRGNAHVGLKQWSQAVDDYARGVTDATTDEALLSNQALAMAEVSLGGLSVSDDPTAFDRSTRQFAAMKLTDPWQKLAAAYRILGNQQAIDELVERRPQLAGKIGDWFLQDQDWQRAVEIYSRGITPDSPNLDLLSKRARSSEELKNWEAAAADWSRAAAGNPAAAKLLGEFARRAATGNQLAIANSQFKESQTHYERALKADPENNVTASDLAQLLFDMAASKDQPDWVVLKPAENQAEGLPELAVQDDGSILIAAAPTPESERIRWQSGPHPVRALRIETSTQTTSPATSAAIFSEYQIVTATMTASENSALRGRFVRLDLPGSNSRFPRRADDGDKKTIGLAEVQAFQGDRNIAFRQPARQSSDFGNLFADRAVDGNTVGTEQTQSWANTGIEDNPWWEVDLGSEQAIDRIVVWNRSNVDLYLRMNHFRVRVLDHSRKVVFEQVIDKPPSPSTEIAPLTCLAETKTETSGDDRILKVRLPFSGLIDAPRRFRVSSAAHLTDLALDETRDEAMKVTDVTVRLAAAYAQTGQGEEAFKYFSMALKQAKSDEAKKPIVELAARFDDVLQALFQSQPHEIELQLAMARRLAQRGQNSLAANQPAEALADLQKSRDLIARLKSAEPQWTVLTPVEMKSVNGARMELQSDGSVFVHQQPLARNDIYSVVLQSDLPGLNALRLEALADSRLPKGGPGTKEDYGNFVLGKLTLQGDSSVSRDQPRSLDLRNASADFTENGFSIQSVITGNYPGWAVGGEINKDHAAVFELAERVDDGHPLRLTVQLHHSGPDAGYNLGRFRLSVTNDAATPQTTRIRWNLKNAEIASWQVALAQAQAQSGQTSEAVASFGEALNLASDRDGLARVIAAAAPLRGMLEKLTEHATGNAQLHTALARHFTDQGDNKQANAARSIARNLFEQQLAKMPDNVALASELTDLLMTDAPEWSVLKPIEMKSEGGATLALQPDGSILASGANPDLDAYTITAEPGVRNITTIRLEALPDASLPESGPGRAGNFHLAEIELVHQGSVVEISGAIATYDQGDGFTPETAVDGNKGSGWAISPKHAQSHTAYFQLKNPISLTDADQISINLNFFAGPPRHALGRFRLSVSDDVQAFVLARKQHSVAKIVDPWAKLAAAYSLSGDVQRAADLLARSVKKIDLVPWLESLNGEVLESLQGRHPDSSAALLPKAAPAAAELGKFDLARDLYERLVKLQPDHELWKERLGQLRPGILAVWNFDVGTKSWIVVNNCEITVKNGVLTARTTGNDPNFMTPVSGPAGGKAVVLRYRTDEPFTMEVFWGDSSGGPDESHVARYPIPASATEWREITLPFWCYGTLKTLRLDPNTAKQHPLEIDSIVLRRLEPSSAWNQFPDWVTRKAIIDFASGKDEILLSLVERHPDEPLLQVALARKLAKQGDTQQAKAARDTALALLEAKLAKELNKSVLAVELADVLLSIGDLFAAELNWERAISEYSKAIIAGAKDARIFAARAAAYEKLERWEPAAADWFSADLHSSDKKARYGNPSSLPLERLAQLHDRLGQWDKQIEDYTELLTPERSGEFPWWYKGRGEAYEKLHQWDKARDDYDQAVKVCSVQERELFQLFRSMHFAAQGKWKQAADDARPTAQIPIEVNIEWWRLRNAALIFAVAGDEPNYCLTAKRCYEKLTAGNLNADETRSTIQTMLLFPGMITDENRPGLLEMVEKTDAYWNPRLTAGIYFRSGDEKKAAELFEANAPGGSFIFMASKAHQQLGNQDRARQLFEDGNEWVRNLRANDPGSGIPKPYAWQDWAIIQILHREATRKLAGVPVTALEWESAIAVYNMAINDDAPDTALLADRANAYLATEKWELAKADWKRVIAIQPDQTQAVFEAFQKAERWNEAADFAPQLIKRTPKDTFTWLKAAPVLALADDPSIYSDFCERMAVQFQDLNDQTVEQVIKACLLRVNSIDLSKLPVEKLAKIMDEGTVPDWFNQWGWGTRAMWAYRSGDAELAVKYVAKSEEHKPEDFTHAVNLAVLAMARHQQKQPEAARQALDEASQLINRLKADENNKLNLDLLIAQILFREAETLINGKPKP